MCEWRLVAVVVLTIIGVAGCGPVTMQTRAEDAERSGDWAKAMANYDFEYEASLPGERAQLEGPRNNAATKWIESELAKAKALWSSDNPEAAFGILSTLTREAKKRKLTGIDETEIQPFLTAVVERLLPKVMAATLAQNNAAGARREARVLLALLDPKGEAKARAAGTPLMQPHIDRETQLAATAQTEGRIASAYFHRALADDDTLKVRTDDEQKASREQIDKIANFWWMTDGASSCGVIDVPTTKFVMERKQFGSLARQRVRVAM